mmetsp:Transcript_47160/g.85143  ORF Transcript_47160/g.85143 Transcript_47160/m.85143 type:complete len:611 (+) Transcript_47160:142-1974(+)
MASADGKEELIINTFRRFDANKDGLISREELRRVLCSLDAAHFNEETVDKVLSNADTNADGKIQYEEFVSWVMKETPAEDPEGDRAAIDWRGFLPKRFQVDISHRYSLDKLALGEGGYGKVFIAKDEKTGRLVAVKKVTKIASDKKRTEAFYTEIEIMKELDHPNICRLLEVFEHGRHIFFVMEFCEGGEVFDRILETGSVSEAITADIIKQVAAALRYAHGRKIAHRDIKPENIVFCTKDRSDLRVKLIDWGLGISFGGSVMRTAVGSFTYAAPEVISSRNVTAYTQACDIWSLGVVAYVMLCGKPPFWGTEHQHLAHARAGRFPMSGGPIWPSISDEAKDFIRSTLKGNASERPTIDEVASHPWLTKMDFEHNTEAQAEVMLNMRKFSNTGVFTALCISSVARQLDHRHLKDIHKVFREMDINGDGYLSIDEIKDGFKKIHGEDSEEYKAVEASFRGLDLDGSGIVDYTEFCAAGMGAHVTMQEDAIWAAFKAFDMDNTGKIEAREMKLILENADVKKAWSETVCAKVSSQFLEKFDKDGDGSINFDEWMLVMRQCWNESLEGEDSELSKAMEKPGMSSSSWVYDMLHQVNNLDPSKMAEKAETADTA